MTDPTETGNLQQTIDQILIDSVSPRLRQLLDDLLSRGYTQNQILNYVRHLARGRITVLAVEAYLDARANGQPASVTPPS